MLLRTIRPSRWANGIHSYSVDATFRQVTVLDDGSADAFRQIAFLPAVPAVLPRGHFSQLPALKSWFIPQHTGGEVFKLNYGYLHPYGETIVPLELTGDSHASTSKCGEEMFQHFRAPFSLFLDWTRSARPDTKDRLYLAQAQVMELPKKLKDDLPVPDLVAKAGKGDIYDTNIWIGLAPTYTPLHRDPNPNLFVQLAGKKVVRLFKPEIGADIFNKVQAKLGRGGSAAFRGEEMMKGEEKGVLETEVWGDQARVLNGGMKGYEAQLERGDGLFIPQGWWHSVKGIGQGITGS
ncbi:MAG: hypothetical protein M1830_009435, partial [Pleopsidium flavum]